MTTLERPTADTLQLPRALTDARVPRVSEPLRRARAALASATADYLAIPEPALTKVWLFRGIDPEDGVRYGIYRGAETIEVADAELEAALAGAPARAPGAIRCAPVTTARWALQGRLAALDDAILDRVPRKGEWPLRQTLAHTIGGQRGYGLFTRWWLSQPLGASRPARLTDEAEAELDRQMPEERSEAEGSVPDIRARLDDVVDEWSLRVADLDQAALAASGIWSGVPVDIDFRISRWASHIREHTVQIDKTLDWLGYQPSEPVRIVRDMCATWGRLEARIFPVAPVGSVAAVAEILERCSAQLVSDAESARAAAEA